MTSQDYVIILLPVPFPQFHYTVDVLEVVNFRQQLRRRVLSLAITVVELRRRCVYSLAEFAGACRRFIRRHDRPSLVGQCYFVASTLFCLRQQSTGTSSFRLSSPV